MTAQPDPPPSLLSYEAPLLASGPAAVAQAAAAGARRLALKGADAGLEDILNSMLPPRYVIMLVDVAIRGSEAATTAVLMLMVVMAA